jgi:hypothetical protein
LIGASLIAQYGLQIFFEKSRRVPDTTPNAVSWNQPFPFSGWKQQLYLL